MLVGDRRSLAAQHLGQTVGLGAADEHGAGAVGAGAQLLHRSFADQPPRADDDHSVDGLLDLRQQVARHQHGAALVVGEVAEEAAQPLDPLGVQAVGRFVQHQDGGIAEQCGGQRQPLSHTQRVATGAAVAGVGQAYLGQDLVGAGERESRGPAVDPQVVAGGARRVEGGLEHGADGPQRVGQRRVRRTVERRRPGVGAHQAQDHPQRRRLPRAVGPEEAGDRPRFHREAQIGDGPDGAEGLAEPTDVDPHGGHRRAADAGNRALLVLEIG